MSSYEANSAAERQAVSVSDELSVAERFAAVLCCFFRWFASFSLGSVIFP